MEYVLSLTKHLHFLQRIIVQIYSKDLKVSLRLMSMLSDLMSCLMMSFQGRGGCGGKTILRNVVVLVNGKQLKCGGSYVGRKLSNLRRNEIIE